MNVSKAGQAIPLKWRLTRLLRQPGHDLASVTVKVADQGCVAGDPERDQIEEYARGIGSAELGRRLLPVQLEDAGRLRVQLQELGLDLGEGVARERTLAYFSFKK